MRITWKKPNGEFGIKGVDLKSLQQEVYIAICKLKDYEDTGLTPRQVEQMDEMYRDKCEEVARLKKEVQ